MKNALPSIKSYKNFKEFTKIPTQWKLMYCKIALEYIDFTPYPDKLNVIEIIETMQQNKEKITGARMKVLWSCLHFIADTFNIMILNLRKFCKDYSRTSITQTDFKSWLRSLGCDPKSINQRLLTFAWTRLVNEGIFVHTKGRYFRINKSKIKEMSND